MIREYIWKILYKCYNNYEISEAVFKFMTSLYSRISFQITHQNASEWRNDIYVVAFLYYFSSILLNKIGHFDNSLISHYAYEITAKLLNVSPSWVERKILSSYEESMDKFKTAAYQAHNEVNKFLIFKSLSTFQYLGNYYDDKYNRYW